MISVLIPVYNFSITGLVHDLCRQISADTICEIIVFDDGSDDRYLHHNRAIVPLPNVVYKELGKNYGRVEIRKLLAQTAAYPWLLFLDGDSRIIKNNFLTTYFNALRQPADVVVGGRTYTVQKLKDCRLILHWKYGGQREKTDFKTKAANTYSGFMSNNFLIRKSLFLDLFSIIPLQGYGHEDTYMGIQLEYRNTDVSYIDNPVEHMGLETADRYIAKSENAVRNLLQLEKAVGPEMLSKHVKLYKAYMIFKRYGLTSLIVFLYGALQPLLLRQLKSCHPSLLFFDAYRLGYLVRLKKSTKQVLIKRK